MLSDLRVAVRGWHRSRLEALTLLGVLSLGVGAVVAAGSVAVRVFLDPLPYPASNGIVRLAESVRRDAGNTVAVSYPNASDWLSGGREAIETLGVSRAFQTSALESSAGSRRVWTNYVDSPYLEILGARTGVGRLFTADETTPGSGAAVALVSHELWMSRFAGDSAIVGTTIRLDGQPVVVVGVMGSRFRDVTSQFVDTDVWLPTGSPLSGLRSGFEALRSERRFRVYGRLRQGVSAEHARAVLAAVGTRLEERYPESNRDYGVAVIPLRSELLGQFRTPLLAVVGASAFLLLVALANVTSMLGARALERAHDTSVRRMLGADDRALARSALASGLAFAVPASVGAILTAAAITRYVDSAGVLGLPTFARSGLDPTVTLACTALLLIAGPTLSVMVMFLSPGNRRTNIGQTRAESARSNLGLGRTAFVMLQVAMATTLVTAAALLVRSSQAFAREPTGMRVEQQAIVPLQLGGARYGAPDDARAFVRRLLLEAGTTGGEQALAVWAPGSPGQSTIRTTLVPEGRDVASQLEAQITRYHNVSPGALELLGIPVLRGRTFTSDDHAEAPPVAMVSASLAGALWPGESPLGKRVRHFVAPEARAETRNPWVEIVGVVGDVRHSGRTSSLMAAPWDVYYPVDQRDRGLSTVSLLLPAAPGSQADVEALHGTIEAIDPELPVGPVTTLPVLLAGEFAISSFVTRLLAFLGTMGLALAVLGLYAVQAQAVNRRRAEFAVRRAVGASGRHFVLLLGRAASMQAVASVTTGLFVAALCSRILATVLFDTQPVQAGVYAVSAVVVLVTVCGALAPSVWRAIRLDPAAVLKE